MKVEQILNKSVQTEDLYQCPPEPPSPWPYPVPPQPKPTDPIIKHNVYINASFFRKSSVNCDSVSLSEPKPYPPDPYPCPPPRPNPPDPDPPSPMVVDSYITYKHELT